MVSSAQNAVYLKSILLIILPCFTYNSIFFHKDLNTSTTVAFRVYSKTKYLNRHEPWWGWISPPLQLCPERYFYAYKTFNEQFGQVCTLDVRLYEEKLSKEMITRCAPLTYCNCESQWELCFFSPSLFTVHHWGISTCSGKGAASLEIQQRPPKNTLDWYHYIYLIKLCRAESISLIRQGPIPRETILSN